LLDRARRPLGRDGAAEHGTGPQRAVSGVADCERRAQRGLRARSADATASGSHHLAVSPLDGRDQGVQRRDDFGADPRPLECGDEFAGQELACARLHLGDDDVPVLKPGGLLAEPLVVQQVLQAEDFAQLFPVADGEQHHPVVAALEQREEAGILAPGLVAAVVAVLAYQVLRDGGVGFEHRGRHDLPEPGAGPLMKRR